MLLPCRSCSRHIRSHEKVCPFCGEERVESSSKALRVVAAVGVALAISSCEARTAELANVYGGPPTPQTKPTSNATSNPTSKPATQEAPKEPEPRNMKPMYGLPPGR
jgi:hypothetical protein